MPCRTTPWLRVRPTLADNPRGANAAPQSIFDIRFVLRCVFSTKDIEFLHAWRPLRGPPLELQRVAFLIYETQRIGATGARVTTRLRHWCQLFHADKDAAAIVSIAAHGGVG